MILDMSIKLKNSYKKMSSQRLVHFLVAFSAVVGWRLNYIQHGWVNNDFVLYHESARLFSLGLWKQGFEVFEWPLYSILIAFVHKLIGVNLHLAAQILSVLSFTIITYSFLTIIRVSNGNKMNIICGAIILFSANYLIGSVLPMLLRDPGAWAFFLLSLVFFIKLYRSNSWVNAIAWQLSAIIAILFRIEYITFLVLMPLIFLMKSELNFKDRVWLFLKSQSIGIALFISLLITLTFSSSLSINDFGRLREVAMLFGDKYKLVAESFYLKTEIMHTQVLNSDFGGYVTFGLMLALIGMSSAKCLAALGWLNACLLFFIKPKKIMISHDIRRVLFFSLFLSSINILVIVFSVFLLAGRYTAPLVLALMLMASFALAYLIEQANKSKLIGFKLIVWSILLVIAVSFLKNIWVKPAGTNFQQDAVAWLRKNNINNSQVFFDNSRTRYYADAQFQGIIDKRSQFLEDSIKGHEIDHYEYLVINHSASRPEREELISKSLPQYKIVQRFYDANKKKSIAIYERVK